MYAGDCFVSSDRSNQGDGHHLWVVVSDPFQNDKEVLIVNLTSVRGGRFEDLCCVFEANEHEWITHTSYVAFDCAQVHTDAYLDRCQKVGAITIWKSFPLPLLERIRKAAPKTKNLTGDQLQLLVEQGLC